MTKQNLFLPFFPIFITPSYSTLINALHINNILSNREREREREREMYIRCCNCFRESKSSGLMSVLNSQETSSEATLMASFSVCCISILHQLITHTVRERERERERERRCCWAIYLGRFSKTQQLRQYMSYVHFGLCETW